MKKTAVRHFLLSIRSKLFASFLLMSTIPFLIFLFFNLNATARETEQQALFSSYKMLDETKSYLEYKAVAITEVLNFIAFNDLVQNMVVVDAGRYEDVNLWGTDANKLAKVLNQFRYNPDIQTIQLFMKQGLANAADNPDYLRMGDVEQTPWFRKFMASHASIIWLPSSLLESSAESGRVSVLRKIPNAHNIQEFDGLVRAVIEPNALLSVLDHAAVTPHTSTVIIDGRGEILSASTNSPYSRKQLLNMLEQRPLNEDEDNYWNENASIEGKRMLFGVQAIPGSDTRIAMIVPYSDILKTSHESRKKLISTFLLMIPLALPLSFFMAASATKRLRLLTLYVRKVRRGDLKLSPLPVNQDEIGELTGNFNHMVANISDLIDETYKLGREVKNKELKVLQAQINPHFLYNSLDLINCMALEIGAREISSTVDELALFYKLSLSNGKEIVTLENELLHIQAYVHIQNKRFGGITLISEVPRELYACECPKIALQPLVENSILHGILEKESETGTLTIRARAQQEELWITVEDDGMGMDERLLSALFLGTESKDTGGFGIRNIQERIQLIYGERYGLVYSSAPGAGTTVTLRIPMKGKK